MKNREIFIPDIYSDIKIKSIKRIANDEIVYDLDVKNDGSYSVSKDRVIGSNSDMGKSLPLAA